MDMINQRTQMLNDWANYLDQLKAGKIDNVIYLDNAKAKISDIAQNIVDLFNRVRASFTNLLAPATPAAQANAPAAPSSPSP
jgi:ABC-type transporter Mla subunit MlaD